MGTCISSLVELSSAKQMEAVIKLDGEYDPEWSIKHVLNVF
jgi:hypothetical protein